MGATLSASDRDLPNADIVYSLETRSGVADFMITPQTGELLVHSTLDRETNALYALTVHAAYTDMNESTIRTSAFVTM